jgi:DNA repair protein RecO (recombination protein O)
MSTEKTEALVIRLADWSETSRVVTFFTRDFGQISTVAKGAKRLKGPFEIALDLLTRSQIVFIRKSSQGLDILTECQLVTRFKPHGKDLESLYSGYYVAELLSFLTEPYDPHPILYEEAISTLNHLAEGVFPRLTLLRFELTVLREIGQLPAFDHCVVCNQSVAPDSSYVLWLSQGGIVCRNCQHEEHQQNRIPAGTVAVLRKISQPEADLSRLGASELQLKQMRQVVNSAVSHVLGRRPKMIRYLNY